jgi:transposase
MIGNAMYTTILTLWKQKKSKSEIARITGHDRKTISAKASYSKLSFCKEEILKLLEKDLSGVRIHEELARLGFQVGYSTLTRFINKIKSKNKICIRFHTEAGEEGQVDFGYVGKLPDTNGSQRKAWVFNMRLSYSRLDYFEVVFDQKVETFIKCHINAFKYFGGVPKTVKIDNLKAAILEANFYEPIYQKFYKDFADHYQFNPIACRVRMPQEKGKTESGIKYVKGNFFKGRHFSNYSELSRDLNHWLEHKCNSRIHGTHKQIPKELFDLEEKAVLTKLPIADFSIVNIGCRKVHSDCHISVDGNYYSVPYKYVGMTIEIKLNAELLKVYHQGEQIAVHPRHNGKGNFITTNSHYPKYKLFSPTCIEYQNNYRQKLSLIGTNASKIFEELLVKQPYEWYRTANGILSLQKLYSNQVIDAACARALSFDLTLYSKIKNICQSGTYNLPLEQWEERHAFTESAA